MSSKHEAAPSTLGYLYQSRWPLVELLRRAVTDPDAELTVELYDDVIWGPEGAPTELLQVKHHVKATGRLGDMDADWWRTIASWMDAHSPGDPYGPTLTLLTTSLAGKGTAAEALRPGAERDPIAARSRLDEAARTSTAETTRTARQRFLALPDGERSAFVYRIHVLDGAPHIGDELQGEVVSVLYWALPRDHEDLFLEQLWGWWDLVVVSLLQQKRATISALEVKAKIDDMRDRFGGDHLPTIVRLQDVEVDQLEGGYAEKPFVEQLRWIALTATLLQKAMIDYYRAYVQSARWLDEHLIAFDELAEFEVTLKDEWERQFEFMKLALPAGADEATQQNAGRELFRLVTENSTIRLRRYGEAFFTKGKLHELADDGKVGWHPDFAARMAALLLEESA